MKLCDIEKLQMKLRTSGLTTAYYEGISDFVMDEQTVCLRREFNQDRQDF